MKPRRLESLTISNFRSIGGRVTIPFDAPVVLIHGPNGSGKTSILSALELAMSGSIDAMRRVDPRYVDHLIHRGSGTAEIELAVQQDTAGPTRTWAMTSRDEGWARDHLLSNSDAVHYSERSYLAQATLGRLLEIYSESESSQSSALTRFVNDVLGLDTLEALIEGLRNGRDIRNTRNLVPGFAGLERSIAANKIEHSAIEAQNKALSVELREADELIANELTRLEPEVSIAQQAIGEALNIALIESEDAELTRLIEGRREIEVMRRRLLETQDTGLPTTSQR